MPVCVCASEQASEHQSARLLTWKKMVSIVRAGARERALCLAASIFFLRIQRFSHVEFSSVFIFIYLALSNNIFSFFLFFPHSILMYTIFPCSIHISYIIYAHQVAAASLFFCAFSTFALFVENVSTNRKRSKLKQCQAHISLLVYYSILLFVFLLGR